LPLGLVVGAAMEEALMLCEPRWRKRSARLVIALVLIGGFVGSHIRVTDIEPHRYFVTPEDMAAMEWIKENTPKDALFAVNTYFWLPRAPHGTDAGYWIPYLTGRQMTAGVMLLSLGGTDYRSIVVEMSQAVEQLEVNNDALEDLQALGVDYVYVGQRGDFSGLGLDIKQLDRSKNASMIYQNGKVAIFRTATSVVED